MKIKNHDHVVVTRPATSSYRACHRGYPDRGKVPGPGATVKKNKRSATRAIGVPRKAASRTRRPPIAVSTSRLGRSGHQEGREVRLPGSTRTVPFPVAGPSGKEHLMATEASAVPRLINADRTDVAPALRD